MSLAASRNGQAACRAGIVGALTAHSSPMSNLAPLNNLITRFRSRRRSAPVPDHHFVRRRHRAHGGTVWLGSLINLLEPIGINERLIRTSIFRLTKEGWLTAEKVGRRSYYSLTGTGRRRFEKAFKRVYSPSQPAWDGAWTLVLLSQLEAGKRKALREELEWQGFGTMAPNLLELPRADRADLAATLRDLEASDDSIVFETRTRCWHQGNACRVRESWRIDELGQQYSEFIQLFRPLWQGLKSSNSSMRRIVSGTYAADSRIPPAAAARPATAGRAAAGDWEEGPRDSCAVTSIGWCLPRRKNG